MERAHSETSQLTLDSGEESETRLLYSGAEPEVENDLLTGTETFAPEVEVVSARNAPEAEAGSTLITCRD